MITRHAVAWHIERYDVLTANRRENTLFAPLYGALSAGVFCRPGEEHRAGFGYVRDDQVEPWMAELFVHEQQREPKLAAGVVDTGLATAGVSEFL